MTEILLLIAVVALVAAIAGVAVVGGQLIGWERRERRQLRPGPYLAEWHPLITNTERGAKVYITKAAHPGQRIEQREALMFLGEVPGDAEDFDERMEALLVKAEKRAATMSLEQNTHNRYGG